MRPKGRNDKQRKINGDKIRAGMGAEIDKIKASLTSAPLKSEYRNG